MDRTSKGVHKRILLISLISTIIIVGNIFLLTWSWGHNPIWVSVITTIVALNSLFAWVVAFALFIEE